METEWCLYLHTVVCTDERGTFRHLEIAPKEDPDLSCGGLQLFPEVKDDLF